MRKAEAVALPGALEFAERLTELGVTLFYVTNRTTELETATRANLVSEGFPFDQSRDVLLTRGENGWGSDKNTRRAEIAKSHRILLLMGDDLNDFFSGARAETPGERLELTHRAQSRI